MSAENNDAIDNIIPDLQLDGEAAAASTYESAHQVAATYNAAVDALQTSPFEQPFPATPERCVGCPAIERRNEQFEALKLDQAVWGTRTLQELPVHFQVLQLIAEHNGAPALDINEQDETFARSWRAEARAFPQFCEGVDRQRSWWQTLTGQVGTAACRSALL